MVMDNVIVVSDDDEDEAKDVVNGDSNSDSYRRWPSNRQNH